MYEAKTGAVDDQVGSIMDSILSVFIGVLLLLWLRLADDLSTITFLLGTMTTWLQFNNADFLLMQQALSASQLALQHLRTRSTTNSPNASSIQQMVHLGVALEVLGSRGVIYNHVTLAWVQSTWPADVWRFDSNSKVRYLEIPWTLESIIKEASSFKCSVCNAEWSFCRSFNSIFGRVGRVPSNEVIIQLLKVPIYSVLWSAGMFVAQITIWVFRFWRQ